ncbi:MAG: hypothetical protein HQK54_18045 [Oligoflexales bacterium]|nr:hypothetical protein [Oligoflexales bacterium]
MRIETIMKAKLVLLSLILVAGGCHEPKSKSQQQGNEITAIPATPTPTQTITITPSVLSLARSGMAAITVGSKTLFAGGYVSKNTGADRYSNVVDIYDASTNTWSQATLPKALGKVIATSVGSKAIFASGGIYPDDSDAVDIYDESTNTWSQATLSKARSAIRATSVGSKAIFAGGLYTQKTLSVSSSNFSNVVDIYDASTNTWSQATISQGRHSAAAATVGTKAIFAGGAIGSTSSNVVDIYDLATNSWSKTTMPKARTYTAVTVVGPKALFAGAGLEFSDDVDIYDMTSNTWSKTTLPKAIGSIPCYLKAVTIGSKAIFAGKDEYAAEVEIYDVATQKWFTATLPKSRQGFAMISIGASVLFAGGYTTRTNPSSDMDRVDIYDLPSNTWK